MEINIKVDFRERRSGILNILKGKEGITIEEQGLYVGDYSINNSIVVERKTTKDFIASIIEGRLFKQASRLKRFTERPIFIVEGEDLFNTPSLSYQAIKGAIISLSVVWYIPVVFLKDVEDTAQFLITAGIQDMKCRTESGKRPGRKPKRLKGLKLYFLQGLPDIGPALAQSMLKQFGSIEKVITADEAGLASVEGIGKKKASSIVNFVRS